MSKDLETKTIFGIGDSNGTPLIVLGIPEGAWKDLLAGKTNTFDFSKAGLNVKMVIYGAKDHKTALATIQQASDLAAAANFAPKPKTDLDSDFSINLPKDH